MINKELLLEFICQKFSNNQLYIDKFKPNIWFIDIDCFLNMPYKLAIVISDEDILFSTVDKKPVIDFSLYDFKCLENKDAENFIDEVFLQQKFIYK